MRFCALLFALCCWAAPFWPGICVAGERTYTVTETELAQLEANLARQESTLLTALALLGGQERELGGLRIELRAALGELAQSKAEIGKLKASLNAALESIGKANRLLREYEKETKSRLRAAKWQRNGWAAGFVALLAWAAGK
jgi:peptidoglycan hydrolase CwlO-like protein